MLQYHCHIFFHKFAVHILIFVSECTLTVACEDEMMMIDHNNSDDDDNIINEKI